MTTETTKIAVKAANTLRKIANAYDIVYESGLIENDMEYYAQETIDWSKTMRDEKSFWNYTKTLWIRKQGVESSKERADFFGNIVAKVTISFDKETKNYTITKENI